MRLSLRWSLACAAVALVTSVLAGCGRSVEGTPVRSHGAGMPPASSTVKSPPAQQDHDFDISRITQLKGEFPPGFDRVGVTPVATLGPDADKFSAIAVGDVVAVAPPTCRSLLQPVRPPQDAQFTAIGGVGQGAIMVGAVKSPAPLAKRTVPAGCEHVVVTQRLSGRKFDSTVTRGPGPAIEGLITTESTAIAAQGGAKSFVFAAFVSDTVAVAVQGILPGNPDAEEILGGLLVKAVNVIRAA